MPPYPRTISVKFSMGVKGRPRYQMPQKNCNFQPAEQVARTLQTERRHTNGQQYITRSIKKFRSIENPSWFKWQFLYATTAAEMHQFCKKSTEVDCQVDHLYSSQSVDWQRFNRLSQSMVRQLNRSYAQQLTWAHANATSHYVRDHIMDFFFSK